MESFVVLKEKITLLVGHIKKLQSEKDSLAKEFDKLGQKNDELNVENAKLAEENAQLIAKIKEAESSFVKESKEVAMLSKEREFAKVAVDDLIKSIDGLVGSEKQQ